LLHDVILVFSGITFLMMLYLIKESSIKKLKEKNGKGIQK